MSGVPTWTPGQVLASADVNTWFVPLAVYTGTDDPITSQTAFQNDAALSVPVAADSTYEVHLHLVFTGPASNQAVFNLTGPSGAAGSFSVTSAAGLTNNTNTPLNDGSQIWFLVETQGTTNADAVAVEVHGTLVVAGTAGTFQFQFAQGASSSTATTRKGGSSMVLRRIA
jgi:hypothetical protein